MALSDGSHKGDHVRSSVMLADVPGIWGFFFAGSEFCDVSSWIAEGVGKWRVVCVVSDMPFTHLLLVAHKLQQSIKGITIAQSRTQSIL